MNCEVCGKKISATFLNKIVGTYVKDSRGKKHCVCFECQRRFPEKAMLLQQIR